MSVFGWKRTRHGRPLIALPCLLAILLMSGCAFSGPGLPGIGLPGGLGGGSSSSGGGDVDRVCLCKKSELPVCCDECPESPACQG